MEQVLMEVGKMIGSYPFKFQGALSGVKEGAYGWIAINYLLSSFIKYSYEGKRLHPKNRKILGALDMGGASTQITFTPEGRIADKQTEASFRYEHTAYTDSFLSYGKMQFMNSVLAKLVKAASAFFYTFDFLKLAPQPSLDVKKKTTEEFCKKDWSSVQKENNLREYCATSYCITTLLVDAYIFDYQSWNKIVFEKKADDPDICWMLGYTLKLTNLIPTETPASAWAASVFFIVLVIALSLLALVVQCYTQCRHSFNSHQSASESPKRGQGRRGEGGRGLVNIEAKYGFVPILVFDAEMTTMV
ncbi:UNVERIFIED_CONTAM: hypothetical protein FKN15_023208 [Acipenser sinensis]